MTDWRADAWYGILAPVGTPAAVIAALQQNARDYVADAKTRQTLTTMGLDADSTCGADFGAQIAREIDTYTEMARTLNVSGS